MRDLERRPRLKEEDRELAAAHDRDVAVLLDQVAGALLRPLRANREWLPPKRVATAMALALHSAPHFVATLPRPTRDGSADPREPARRPADLLPVVTNEVLERALGVGQWEGEELREEVDRRAGKALKQVRTVNWLWSYFGQGSTASTLSRILFPGAAESDLVRRGGHLYLLVDLPDPPSPYAGWLPWLAPEPTKGGFAFASRTVDKGLRNRIARGVGADDDEVAELLDGMVSLVPRETAAARIHLDQWRSYGYAAVTDLGLSYTAGDWLVRPIPADGADWRAWLRTGPDGLEVKGTPEKVFDALALPRVAAMTRLLYAALLASVDRDGRPGPDGFRAEDVDLYDVPRHVRSVLAPLLAWAGRTATHQHLAKETGRPVEEVGEALERVRDAWVAHAGTSWYGPPGTKVPSIQTLVLEHLVVLAASLRRLLRREPDPRSEHGDLVLLFAAHYLREARLERLWVKSLSECAEDDEGKIPLPEDIVGHWFWRAWLRLLDEAEHDVGSITGY